jgi:hypothetical protein
MREGFAFRSSPVLVKSPNARHQAARRRGIAVAGVLLLAVVSGVIGALSHGPGRPLHEPQTGPFSYLPS